MFFFQATLLSLPVGGDCYLSVPLISVPSNFCAISLLVVQGSMSGDVHGTVWLCFMGTARALEATSVPCWNKMRNTQTFLRARERGWPTPECLRGWLVRCEPKMSNIYWLFQSRTFLLGVKWNMVLLSSSLSSAAAHPAWQQPPRSMENTSYSRGFITKMIFAKCWCGIFFVCLWVGVCLFVCFIFDELSVGDTGHIVCRRLSCFFCTWLATQAVLVPLF